MFFLKQLAIICSVVLALEAANLPADEVESLKRVGMTLEKTDWNFDVDPCSGESSWITPITTRNNISAVTCDCTYDNNTVCHVVSIILKSQNLTGKVPPEISRLLFLREIDLARNYLGGIIPPEWGSLKLVNISIHGNHVTGPIPKELANISTLANLTLDHNQLSGSIPLEFGNFSAIERIILSSNNLNGEIPTTLAKLTTLKTFRICDNNFTGSIPNFIENWINIERLTIQGSGLAGPIPSGIASLTKLTDLRISDLNGNESPFPPLSNMTMLKTLILRSCNIVGQLPSYIGENRGLKVLDLSFNKLTGPIPESFVGLEKVDYIYLTGNSLTGPVPTWMLIGGDNIDLSYNNLKNESSDSYCQPRVLNLFASSKGNTTGIVSCLRSVGCERNYFSLDINCGVEQVTVKGPTVTTITSTNTTKEITTTTTTTTTTTYNDNLGSGGPSTFSLSKRNWGFSSTGHFIDDDRPTDSYIVNNISSIEGENFHLYTDARISPLSLTYYLFCMENGNYTVKLHFAEIMFTRDRTYSSLGRRIFDVYIQGNRVLKDFNIESEAGGVNKAIVMPFTALITDNTLDIRFYWAGKGTTAIPFRGVYGPLISAISVLSDFSPPSENGNSLSTGAILGIVVGVLFTVLLIMNIIWWKGFRGRKNTLKHDLKGMDFNIASFTLRQIKLATNNFDPVNKIGEGGFGPVYKGVLSDGKFIAVKQLSSKSKQGNREFLNELGMISALQHPHLVKLYGCCIEGNQLLLVYEYMENNSLARALFGQEENQLHLDWPTRHKICIGIARGLAYLHEESRLKVVHRDIKATNILLDKDLSPKISDFGLAKLNEEDNTHISTRIAGTYGYMAPEYAMRGYLTDKADVYSFGVVLLEIVCGNDNTTIRIKQESFFLLDWAHSLNKEGKLMEMVDPRLQSNLNEEEIIMTIKIALLCTDPLASQRPTMSVVVSMLEGRSDVGEFVSSSIDTVNHLKDTTCGLKDGSSHSASINLLWAESLAPISDLYPLTLDTDY